MTVFTIRLAWVLGVAIATVGAACANAQDISEKAATCAGCHGENGIPVNKSYPVIAGQQEGYLYLELRDYKLGHRRNEIMQQVVVDLEKADMRALSAYFAAQPWPNLQQASATDAITHRAETINSSAACKGCHADGYLGDSAIPRAAGQGADYLRNTMLGFKTGERGNNPWMTALLKTYTDADIDALARYLGGL